MRLKHKPKRCVDFLPLAEKSRFGFLKKTYFNEMPSSLTDCDARMRARRDDYRIRRKRIVRIKADRDKQTTVQIVVISGVDVEFDMGVDDKTRSEVRRTYVAEE